MKVVRALDGEPLRGKRTGPLYLVRGGYWDLRERNLTPSIDWAEAFISETGASALAKRRGLTQFEVIDL